MATRAIQPCDPAERPASLARRQGHPDCKPCAIAASSAGRKLGRRWQEYIGVDPKSIDLPFIVNAPKLDLNAGSPFLKLRLGCIVAECNCSGAGKRAARNPTLRCVKMLQGAKLLEHNKKSVDFLARLRGGKKLRSCTVNQLLGIPMSHDLGNNISNVGGCTPV